MVEGGSVEGVLCALDPVARPVPTSAVAAPRVLARLAAQQLEQETLRAGVRTGKEQFRAVFEAALDGLAIAGNDAARWTLTPPR